MDSSPSPISRNYSQ